MGGWKKAKNDQIGGGGGRGCSRQGQSPPARRAANPESNFKVGGGESLTASGGAEANYESPYITTFPLDYFQIEALQLVPDRVWTSGNNLDMYMYTHTHIYIYIHICDDVLGCRP